MLIGVDARLKSDRLRTWREEGHLTQKAAAELAGVSLGAWSALECLHFERVSLEAAVKIAALVEVEVDEIYPEPLRGRPFCSRRYLRREVDPSGLMLDAVDDRQLENDPEAKAIIRDTVNEALKTLTYREREILKLRYGIGYDHTYSLLDVARILRLTRERVRQIEARAIRKLQHPIRASKFVKQLPAP